MTGKGIQPILRLIALLLLIVGSACSPKNEYTSPSPKENSDEKLENDRGYTSPEKDKDRDDDKDKDDDDDKDDKKDEN